MAQTLKVGTRVRRGLFLRAPLEGTVQELREDGSVLVQWDDEPYVRRIISPQVITVIHEEE